jgi:O-antigen biosynthesis protein
VTLPFFSVIVPVLDGELHVADCVASLLRLDYPADRHEILVVDNGSGDRTAEIVRRFPVKLLAESRRGAGNARNAGIEASSGELLAFIDCDCRASTSWLRELAGGFADAEVAGLAGEIVPMPPTTAVERYAARRKPRWQEWTMGGRRQPYFVTANAAMRRSALARVGLFDPCFAGLSCEDMDLSMRFERARLLVRYRPSAVVFHRHRRTVGGLVRQQMRDGRGQALIRRKYGDQLRWGAAEEARAWTDLGAAACRALRAGAGRGGDLEHHWLDFVRRLAQRVGFLHGTVADRALPLGNDRG